MVNRTDDTDGPAQVVRRVAERWLRGCPLRDWSDRVRLYRESAASQHGGGAPGAHQLGDVAADEEVGDGRCGHGMVS